jgi:hypothetical protein
MSVVNSDTTSMVSTFERPKSRSLSKQFVLLQERLQMMKLEKEKFDDTENIHWHGR